MQNRARGLLVGACLAVFLWSCGTGRVDSPADVSHTSARDGSTMAADASPGGADASRPSDAGRQLDAGGMTDAGPSVDSGEPPLNAAQFVSKSIPATAATGAQFTVSVTMRNTGSATWSPAGGYKLGSTDPMDNVTWGTNRVYMDPGASVPPGGTWTFNFQVTAPATAGATPMRWQMVQEAVEWFGDKTEVATVAVTALSWDTDALRRFTGDFGGIYLPEIAPQCPEDPVTHIKCVGDNGGVPHGLINGALFTAGYYNYTDSQRAAIRAAYRARGYTHFPVSLSCGETWYHGLYPPAPCGLYNQFLQELLGDGIVPVCFVLKDGELTADLTGLDKSLCKIVVPMWEMDGPLNNDPNLINQAIVNTRALFPDALLYVHFTAGHVAGNTPEADWWNWAVTDAAGPHLQGILYQDNGADDPLAVKFRVSDLLIRLGGGYHGWPHPVDVVLFETDVYQKFWDGRTEAEGIAWNDQVLDYFHNPACYSEGGVDYCGQLKGFCSGGTMNSTPPGKDAIDLSQVAVWDSPTDIASWPITLSITSLTMATPAGLSFTFDHDPPDAWKYYTGNGPDNYQYTVWAVVKINDQWNTAGFVQMWQGRESTGAPILSDFAINWAFDSRWGPMAGYQPQVGEQMGFFVSAGNARCLNGVTSVRERSNVVVVPLPAGDTGTFTF